MGGNSIRAIWVCAGIAVVLALGGCGGGSDSSSATSGASTAAGGGSTTGESTAGEGGNAGKSAAAGRFAEEANAICERGKKQGLIAMGAYAKQHQSAGKPKAEQLIEAIHAAFLPIVQKQADEIRALTAPAGEEAAVKAFLEALEEGIAAAGKVSSNSQFGSSFKKSAALAHELGIDACAYGG